MIFSRDVSLSGIVKLERPLAYEYDSQTESIVLLNGYKYLVDNEEVNLSGNRSGGFSCEGATDTVFISLFDELRVSGDGWSFSAVTPEDLLDG